MVKLLNVSFKFTTNRPLNEKTDIFEPDINYNVVGISTNFYKKYLDGFEPVKDTKIKSARGRKKKLKVKKNNKINNGMNDQFDSEITFLVFHQKYEMKNLSVKIFRIDSGDITGLIDDNDEEIYEIINSVFNFINYYKPDINIKFISKNINLVNDGFIGCLPDNIIIKHPIYNNNILISYQLDLNKLKELLENNIDKFNIQNNPLIDNMKIEYIGEKNYLIIFIPLNIDLINKGQPIDIDFANNNLSNYKIHEFDPKLFKYCVINIYSTYHVYILGCQNSSNIKEFLDNIREFIDFFKDDIFIPNYSLKNIK